MKYIITIFLTFALCSCDSMEINAQEEPVNSSPCDACEGCGREEVKEDNALINGYPTGVSEPEAVDHDTLPAFTKTKTAKQVFVAGYYIVKFEGMGWQWAFAPRLSTVDKYQHRGPFLTEWEMNLELKKYKRGNIDGETEASIGTPGTG